MQHKYLVQSQAECGNDIVKLPTRRKQVDCLIKKYRWITITICTGFILTAITLAVVIVTRKNQTKGKS